MRAKLYRPVLSAVHYNPWLRAYYEGLIARGKLHKVALLAAMRKLLHAVYRVATHRRPFVPHLNTQAAQQSLSTATIASGVSALTLGRQTTRLHRCEPSSTIEAVRTARTEIREILICWSARSARSRRGRSAMAIWQDRVCYGRMRVSDRLRPPWSTAMTSLNRLRQREGLNPRNAVRLR